MRLTERKVSYPKCDKQGNLTRFDYIEIKDERLAEKKLCELGDILDKYGIDDLDYLEHIVVKNKGIEDIEKKLGTDLITFFKIISAYEVVVKRNNKILLIPCCYIRWENALKGYVDIIVEETKNTTIYREYYFKDYGKTWALTKEELTDGK